MCRTEPASGAVRCLSTGGPLLSEKLYDVNRRPAAAAMNEYAGLQHERRTGRGRSQEHSVGHGLDLDLASRCESKPITKRFRYHDPSCRINGSSHTKMVFRNGPQSQHGGGRPCRRRDSTTLEASGGSGRASIDPRSSARSASLHTALSPVGRHRRAFV